MVVYQNSKNIFEDIRGGLQLVLDLNYKKPKELQMLEFMKLCFSSI